MILDTHYEALIELILSTGPLAGNNKPTVKAITEHTQPGDSPSSLLPPTEESK